MPLLRKPTHAFLVVSDSGGLGPQKTDLGDSEQNKGGELQEGEWGLETRAEGSDASHWLFPLLSRQRVREAKVKVLGNASPWVLLGIAESGRVAPSTTYQFRSFSQGKEHFSSYWFA